MKTVENEEIVKKKFNRLLKCRVIKFHLNYYIFISVPHKKKKTCKKATTTEQERKDLLREKSKIKERKRAKSKRLFQFHFMYSLCRKSLNGNENDRSHQ